MKFISCPLHALVRELKAATGNVTTFSSATGDVTTGQLGLADVAV